MASELVDVEGHVIDSLILAKVLDVILEAGADYRVVEFEIGRTNLDPSKFRLEVSADDDDALARLLTVLQVHGANRVSEADAVVALATTDEVLPAGFYATTNLPTQVRLAGRWVDVENPEMD
ncbi:MAG: TIGR00300 family protein, partial [Actinomycetota bacterium]|nr:TIGR00300 family protein [Actinomycetota bacterium]